LRRRTDNETYHHMHSLPQPTPALQKTSKKSQIEELTWPVFRPKQYKSINNVVKIPNHITKY